MLVNNSYVKGIRFKVYSDGAVFYIKTNEEVGYITTESIQKLFVDNYDRIMVDKFVIKNIKFPATISLKMKNFFLNLKKYERKPYQPKQKCQIYIKDIKKYSNELTPLQYEILHWILEKQESGKTVASRLGINKFYVYKIKSDAIKRIIELKTVNNL